jgi:hypothetical protein
MLASIDCRSASPDDRPAGAVLRMSEILPQVLARLKLLAAAHEDAAHEDAAHEDAAHEDAASEHEATPHGWSGDLPFPSRAERQGQLVGA